MIRVLVAEDSETARSLLVEILNDDPEIEVVGEAKNGLEAVEMVRRLRPNAVTMDIQMPLLNGLEATWRIMTETPTPVIIVSAGLDPGDVEGSLQALRMGAITVARKPSGPTARDFDELCRQLVRTVKSMAQVKVVQRSSSTQAGPTALSAQLPASGAHFRPRVVAIAASVGGPAALHSILSALPKQFPAPILVVQHIVPGYAAGLAEWLSTATLLRVKLAAHGETLTPGVVYIAPDDLHLGVSGAERVVLSDSAVIGGFRPCGTFLFDSVAKAYGSSAVALILTGMGSDGVEGLRAVRQAGGRVLAQDEASCVVFGMPGAAIAAGIVETVLPLSEIASELIHLFESERRSR